jgi:hypothetical protein
VAGYCQTGVLLPQMDDQPPLVALSLVLPVGFSLSPPIFTATTETIANRANENISKWRNPPVHRLDADANSLPTDLPTTPAPVPRMRYLRTPARQDPSLHHKRPRPCAAVDIFVDNFIRTAQGSDDRLQRIRRILLTAVVEVFHPLDRPLPNGTFVGQETSPRRRLQVDLQDGSRLVHRHYGHANISPGPPIPTALPSSWPRFRLTRSELPPRSGTNYSRERKG